MQNVVTANYARIRVGQKRKRKMHFLRVAAIDLDRVNTDRHDLDAARSEIRKTLLKTPQLGVTKRSPMSPVKNQDRAVR